MKSSRNALESIREQKFALREKAYQLRNAQPDKALYSELICAAFTSLDTYQAAETLMLYLNCRSEVHTRKLVEAELGRAKRIVIPYCTKDTEGQNRLGLWWLESMDELVPGTWKIPEPPKARWGEIGKEIAPVELDLIMVPGVAFDCDGGRLGNGQGYYDRLLATVRPDCRLYGVGYESQLFGEIPMGAQDVYLDGVITEKSVYYGRRQSMYTE